MQIFSLPEHVKTVIFDIDGTLYTSPEYVFEQVDVQVRHFAHIRGITEDEARHLIDDFRKKWSSEHGGKKLSLGNTFPFFGISIEESIIWRNKLLMPEKFLMPNEKVTKAIYRMKEKFHLICLTNNPCKAARKTLSAIGLSEIIDDIIGLDTCKKSKPSIEMLELSMKLTKASPSECVAVGDRYDIDISLPLELGMGGILVSDANDIPSIADTLLSCER